MLQPVAQYNRKPKGTIMATTHRLTAVIEREGDWFVALCPELDVASQGRSVEEARAMLSEAVGLFLETASPEEVRDRLHAEVYIGSFEVTVG
jgi:predicted RNase H-like HicB family nuclease